MRQWVFGVDPVFVDRPEKLPALAARQLPILQAGSDNDLDEAFASLARLSASGLVIGQDAFFIGRSKQIAALALHHSAPAIFQFRDFAAAGGLMSYGGEFTDTYH